MNNSQQKMTTAEMAQAFATADAETIKKIEKILREREVTPPTPEEVERIVKQMMQELKI